MTAWDALCAFLRERTYDGNHRTFLTNFIAVFTAWCGDRNYGPFHAADIAPLLRQAGYDIAMSQNGALTLAGLRIKARRH
ncbi:hypothetical protein [Streptomyces olivaceus]|uniref:hypothetical protein n=1 Tax=Streptomyces olivaceus TaxID=47716 RepID=UPI00364B1080